MLIKNPLKNFTAVKNNFNIVRDLFPHSLTHYFKPGITGLFFAHANIELRNTQGAYHPPSPRIGVPCM